MSIEIGRIKLKHGLCLAPMAGYSDRAMRALCSLWGAEYSVTEMISARAVVYGDKKTFALAGIRQDEGAVGLQIFGSEPSIMAEAAGILSNPVGDGFASPVAIDLNMGCPVNKIFQNREGSALMKSPSLIYDICKSVSSSIPLPLTVKLRVGVDEEHINAVECALAAEEGGAKLICMHGRTRAQLYSGEVHREILADVKKALHIPLIANGDIHNAEDALSMLRDTGADGVAIGRGAVGNPFIFSEILCRLEGKPYTPPSLDERKQTALHQLRIAIEEKGERLAVTEARKQTALFFRDFRGAAALRAEINRALCYREVEEAVGKLKVEN